MKKKSTGARKSKKYVKWDGYKILTVHRFSVFNWHWASELGRIKRILETVLTREDVPHLQEQLLG